jgi:double-stranded uracil-DNA glycosylase
MEKRRPTKEEILAAAGKQVPDLIAPDLHVLFCGINPSLYSAVVQHHFARPGNRFWPTLHAAGFTNRLLAPHEEHQLLEAGYGITNIAGRATATADQLSPVELAEGAQRLEEKVAAYRPRFLAVLGISAYRTGFGKRNAVMGLQPETLHGSVIWVLPNPSGLNAHYKPADLAAVFHELLVAVESSHVERRSP